MKSNDSAVYYVYAHVCPVTEEVLYIGKGCKGRAWAYEGSTKNNYNYGCRELNHFKYLWNLTEKGWLPSEWVRIIYRNLTSSEARKLEHEQIDKLRPRFNKIMGKALVKLSISKLKLGLKLRNEGLSYSKIASKLKVSTMLVHRALNNKTKTYKEML